MKDLNIQLQPDRMTKGDPEELVARLRDAADGDQLQFLGEERGDDDGPHIRLSFRAANLVKGWALLRAVYDNTDVGRQLGLSTIATCEGDHGWDDYQLLHHFDEETVTDDLGTILHTQLDEDPKSRIDDALLERLVESRQLIRLQRAEFGEEEDVDGYLVSFSASLMLIHFVNHDIMLDGFMVFRRLDVTTMEVPAPNSSFQEAALRLRGQTPTFDESVDLTSISAALRSIDSQVDALVIHLEEIYPDECYIGTVRTWEDESFELDLLTPGGKWEDTESHDYADITRIDFGGLYDDALIRVAKLRG